MSRWKASTVDVSLGLPGASLSGSWQPDDAERTASWELLVELSTRVTAVDLADEDGTSREALSSLFGLFDTTRDIMRRHGPGVARSSGTGNLSFGIIAVRVLNDVLRPVLSEWHPRLEAYEAQCPPGTPAITWEQQWEHDEALRAELRRVRPVVRQYLLVLAEAADVDELALAVLVPNGGQASIEQGPGRGGGRAAAAALGFHPRNQMVRWFEPGVLVRTGWRILRLRGRPDPREQMKAPTAPTLDFGTETGEFWFDYVADMGDAFDPTMAVAWHLGRDSIDAGEFGIGERVGDVPLTGLPRGRFLVMGGDEVYPYPSGRRYRNQTTGPYSLALPKDRSGTVLAIPGNHDWYDGLEGFESVFLDHRPIGGWQTAQDASWFAVALPAGWWLWALDTGLEGDVNQAQHDYFVEMGARLTPGDRVVLTHPIPAWRLREKRTDLSTDDELGRITELLDEVVPAGVSVPLYLAGDSHIYAHYTQEPGPSRAEEVHHVTSGGGGAFLHPTHNLAPVVPQSSTELDSFHLQAHWPPRTVSRHALAASTSGLAVDRQNLSLVVLLAVVQAGFAALAGISMRDWLRSVPDAGWSTTARRLAEELAQSPATWVCLALVVALCALALPHANVGDPLVRRAARRFGAVHGVAQAAVFLLGAWLGGLAIRLLGGGTAPGVLDAVTGTAAGAVVGGALSVLVFAHYLRIVNQRYRIHDNEAFSGRHLRGYKHFVRCRIDDAGNLRLHVIGLESVRPGWAGALAEDRRPPTTALTLVDVIDIPAAGAPA